MPNIGLYIYIYTYIYIHIYIYIYIAIYMCVCVCVCSKIHWTIPTVVLDSVDSHYHLRKEVPFHAAEALRWRGDKLLLIRDLCHVSGS
jgi:hypothetical protein